jgi:predicted acylesterase/phospholipase RssA
MTTDLPKVLLIVADETSLLPGETAVKNRLKSLNFDVTVKSGQSVTPLDTRETVLIVISSSITDSALGDRLCDVVTPIIASSGELYVSLQMSGSEYVGTAPKQTKIEIVYPKRPGHGMMANMTGVVDVAEEMDICWATKVPRDSSAIAALPKSSDQSDASSELRRIVLFACRVTTPVFGQEAASDPKNFVARRIGFPLDYTKTPNDKSPIWALFDEAVKWAIGKINTRQFDEVFREEWKEIYTRRLQAYEASTNDVTGFDGKSAPENLVGLAFSGGGIRSATFCLGVLQALYDLKLLRIFDYLSTVSGGGYLGGWWSAWLSRPVDKQNPRIFPAPERIEPQRLEQYRWRTQSAKVAEGSLSAGDDPIHHLRLFANYLTPRKGGLGGDTWRAITVVTRNLLLTWLILLPLLFALVILAQSFFMPYRNPEFFHTHWTESQRTAEERQAQASLITDEKALKIFNQETETILDQRRSSYHEILKRRAVFIMLFLAPFVGWIAFLVAAFLQTNAGVPVFVRIKDWFFSTDQKKFQLNIGGMRVAYWLGLLGAIVILISVTYTSWFADTVSQLDPQLWWWARLSLLVWAIVGVGLIAFTLPWRRLEQDAGNVSTEEELRRGVWRNRITNLHTKLLVFLSVLATILVFAAYGHEMFDYLLYDATPQFLAYVAKIGGWATFLGAIAGSIFSALKSAPSGGHDSGEIKPPPPWQKVIFAITPVLVVISLLILAAWVAHEISRSLVNFSGYPWLINAVILVGISLSLLFALFEIPWDTAWAYFLLPLFSLVLIAAAFGLYTYLQPPDAASAYVRLVQFAVVVGGVLLFRLLLKGDRWSGGAGRFKLRTQRKPEPKKKTGETKSAGEKKSRTWSWWTILAPLSVTALVIAGVWISGIYLVPSAGIRPALAFAAVSSIALCFVYVLFEILLAKGDNLRSISLFIAVYVVSFTLLLISFHGYAESKLPFISLGLFAGTLTWVIAFGWMADPNAISMHGFYKSRLVRAYLGASNPKRLNKLYEITETVVGDDVLLNEMKNCQRGAPYHLINTTLNLTGGRDLATAQRSSAMFVLSKLYCGSFRTGFQRSERYMKGNLSLGTAVATSGAAVSPGMGAGKTTASQSMLMTLLNLRLGFWAPTPSGEHWESPYARLWPFYLVRESLSQTNDLSSYCYLTDGGHFDNLGLYSLVERGCRYIVVVDAVADPQPCFSDLGNAIRRCRLDFNAEIDLDITPFIKSRRSPFAKQHYVVGSILYAEKHVKQLGWNDTTEPARTGVVVYIKSSLVKDEKSLRADVRQYGIENAEFPQQSTIDQWFDEAQFESYRQLGNHCVRSLFDKLAQDPHQQTREALNVKKTANNLSAEEASLLTELEDEKKVLDGLKGPTLSPSLIKGLFGFAKRTAP